MNLCTTNEIVRLVINVDVDTSAAGAVSAQTGLRQQDVLREVQRIDPAAAINIDGEIELDGDATKVALIRWETSDPPAPGLPNQETLERLVSAAIAAVYPARAVHLQNWLDGRPDKPTAANVKEHSWSYMAGWFAEHGCDHFYSHLWNDPAVVAQLQSRLQAAGAWQIATDLAS